ncbi:hypothetical protein [Salinispora arenicola]|uniref:hypothetical protein n=1 Tax=Salinispora arenicola TaxID=168697 RepID=UPI00035F397F|nr:hypothetical protein [Salinispora arenicola]
MTCQNHTHKLDRAGTGRARSRRRWSAAGLAGAIVLALTTAGMAAASTADAVGRTVTTTQLGVDQPGKPIRDEPPAGDHRDDRGNPDDSKHAGAKGQKEGRRGAPVSCDPDRLIAAIKLANARDGAVLDLADDCTYLLTANIDGAGLPAITSPVTLNGGDGTTIERAAAADQFRILTVNAGGDLTLNHLKVTGGQTPVGADGGGILVNAGGRLTARHSKILGNIGGGGGGGSGGGIANLGVTAIKNSTVNQNTAGFLGGGIYNTGLLTIRKSHVEANSGPFGGGGVTNSGGTMRVTHSAISGNRSIQGAGLFVVDGGNGAVSDTRITDNTATIIGGGVYLSGQLTMRRAVLAANTAVGGGGGGLFVSAGSTATIEGSVVKDNTATGATGFGGGIFNNAETTVRGTKVIGNVADQGGGLHNDPSGVLTLVAVTVTDNIAITDGGGVFNAAGGVVALNTATGTTVIGNQPNNCVNVPGCAG